MSVSWKYTEYLINKLPMQYYFLIEMGKLACH